MEPRTHPNSGAQDLPTVSLRRQHVSYVAAAALLLVFGAVRLPVETRMTRENRAANFSNAPVNLGLREKIGQLGFLAALSGFRTLVADLLWIQAHADWQRVEYGPMNLIFNTVTTLTPHNVNFWDMSSWHMAYNASVAAMNDPAQPKLALKLKREHEYFMIGVGFLQRGIANNPGAYVLHQSLGAIYRDKLHDHWNAYLQFDKAAALAHAPTYEKRFAAYELSQCPGRERQAWEKLRKLYDMGPQERLPTLENDLKAMEEALDLPEDQRIYKTPIVDPLQAIDEKLQIPSEQRERVYKTP